LWFLDIVDKDNGSGRTLFAPTKGQQQDNDNMQPVGADSVRPQKWQYALHEIGEFFGGMSGKSKSDFSNGNAKYVTYKNIFDNYAIDIDKTESVKIGQNEKQRTVQKGDIIFTGSSETKDECGMSSVLLQDTNEPLYLNSFCFGFRLFDKNLLLPSFAKYLFRSDKVRKQIMQTASGVTRFNVSKAKMENVKIIIPPIATQQYIVSILDKFDALVNDISQGLPAEIKARQQQYEYYRNLLLSFK
jgi:type I restriction enzyme S subunit